MSGLLKRYGRADILALALLIALWMLFFWRLLTPVEADQASFTQGDFSGQFFAYAGYQYARFAAGEVPLWDPYNNGGLPFIADTQAAVFYPPRLATIALANLSGGWTYHALELEAIFHVLAYTLLMYVFVRRLTGSSFGGLAAALVGGYGGFLTGYPPLQLAILEAGTWLPLAALGIYEATERQEKDPADESSAGTSGIRWSYLVLTGFALGMSWMAGHPQTSFFLTYVLVAYFAYRVYARRAPFWVWLIGTAGFGIIAGGLAAVQFLPGVEYLSHTTRIGFGYDVKDNGFPLQDITQFLLPGVVSQWSPLYVGISGLTLALIGIWRRWKIGWFWGAVTLLALLWSFGGNAAVFPALYNILPGLRYFRGQERAAFLVANGLAVLAGIGATALASWDAEREHLAGLRLRINISRAVYGMLALAALIFISWIGNTAAYGKAFSMAALGAGVLVVCALLISAVTVRADKASLIAGLIAVLTFELFTVNMGFDAVYDPIPPAQQIDLTASPLVATILADTNGTFRVDGFRGLTNNYGSLYGVQDIRGISPLWIAEPYSIIEGDLPAGRAWELFAVRYVLTDWQELPVPSTVIATGSDRYGAVNLHRLSDPRPFALLIHDARVVSGEDEALAILHDPAFDPRRTILLSGSVVLNGGDPEPAQIVQFAPEKIVISANTDRAAALSIALPYYPGWEAIVDGKQADLLRADDALSAVLLPPGSHTVELLYNPLSYRIGAIFSAVSWLGLLGFGIYKAARKYSRNGDA